MPGTFEELGMAAELASGVEAMGWAAPSGLQRDAIPILRRGNNAVLYAASGSGSAGAYGLAVLDRLLAAEAGGAPRALVLVPTSDTASRTAASHARLAAPVGTAVRALAPGWPARPADVLVASATTAVAAIRDSSLKVDALTAVIIDGADQFVATGQWDALETILESVPADSQRILVTARFDAAIDGLVERHLRKAMTIPPRPTDGGVATTSTARYVVVPDRERTAAVVALLASTDADTGEVALVCRSPARAERLSTELTARGVALDAGTPRVVVLPRLDADQRSTKATVISCDVPLDAGSLSDLHTRGGTIVATPRELTHLRLIASRAAIALEPAKLPVAKAADPTEALRERLRTTAKSADLAADLALIEPLLEEFPAPELAAAALHLARSAAAMERERATHSDHRTGPASGAARADIATAPPPGTAWIRLFITAGSRDGLGPGDLVGAITGETGLAGEQVGKIEVRESHSTVEVPSGAAESVIAALNGRSLRGRSLRVDYDRKERTQKKPTGSPGPRGGGSRSGGSRPGGSRPPGRGPRSRD